MGKIPFGSSFTTFSVNKCVGELFGDLCVTQSTTSGSESLCN